MQLSVGDLAPPLRLPDQTGQVCDLSEWRGHWVLVFFYPKALTPGCTRQAVSVQEALPELVALDVQPVGVSLDPPERQAAFAQKYGLTYPLLADVDHTAAEAWGVWGEKKLYGRSYMGVIRSAFLVDPEGRLAGVWYKVSPAKTVPNALAARRTHG